MANMYTYVPTSLHIFEILRLKQSGKVSLLGVLCPSCDWIDNENFSDFVNRPRWYIPSNRMIWYDMIWYDMIRTKSMQWTCTPNFLLFREFSMDSKALDLVHFPGRNRTLPYSNGWTPWNLGLVLDLFILGGWFGNVSGERDQVLSVANRYYANTHSIHPKFVAIARVAYFIPLKLAHPPWSPHQYGDFHGFTGTWGTKIHQYFIQLWYPGVRVSLEEESSPVAIAISAPRRVDEDRMGQELLLGCIYIYMIIYCILYT